MAGAQPNISGDDIEGIKIPLLPLPTQEKVADCFRFMDQVSSTLSSLAVAMRSQKQSLMRSLLTGKIRVKV